MDLGFGIENLSLLFLFIISVIPVLYPGDCFHLWLGKNNSLSFVSMENLSVFSHQSVGFIELNGPLKE